MSKLKNFKIIFSQQDLAWLLQMQLNNSKGSNSRNSFYLSEIWSTNYVANFSKGLFLCYLPTVSFYLCVFCVHFLKMNNNFFELPFRLSLWTSLIGSFKYFLIFSLIRKASESYSNILKALILIKTPSQWISGINLFKLTHNYTLLLSTQSPATFDEKISQIITLEGEL